MNLIWFCSVTLKQHSPLSQHPDVKMSKQGSSCFNHSIIPLLHSTSPVWYIEHCEQMYCCQQWFTWAPDSLLNPPQTHCAPMWLSSTWNNPGTDAELYFLALQLFWVVCANHANNIDVQTPSRETSRSLKSTGRVRGLQCWKTCSDLVLKTKTWH